MRGILERFQQLEVAGKSPAVVGWAGTLALQAKGEFHFFLGGLDTDDLDLVYPVVAEIVGVGEFVALLGDQVAERVFPLVAEVCLRAGTDEIIGIKHPVFHLFARAEGVQVGIGPPHDDLDDIVQPVEFDFTRHDEAAPDRRLQVAEGNLQLHRLAGERGLLASRLRTRRGEWDVWFYHGGK